MKGVSTIRASRMFTHCASGVEQLDVRSMASMRRKVQGSRRRRARGRSIGGVALSALLLRVVTIALLLLLS